MGLVLLLSLTSACTYVVEPNDLPCGPHRRDGLAVDGTLCASRRSAALTIDSAMPVDLATTIMQAGDDWSTLTDGRVNFTWSMTDTDPDISIDPTITIADGELGVYHDATSHITFRDRLDGDNLRIIASHELGHFLGLGHHDDGEQVMNTSLDIFRLGPKDLAWFDALYAHEDVTK